MQVVDKDCSKDILSRMELVKIQEPIRPELEMFERQFQEVLSSDSPMIYEITQHLLQKRGKRLRPVSLFLAAKACGDENLSGLDAAVAIELIHTATLLHDDVIDESELRRGQYSVNHKWNNTISVLMGDYLFAKAFKSLVKMKSAAMYSAISQATERVSIGQLDEIREMRNFDLSQERYFYIITNKTASLFAAACQAGGLCALKDEKIEQDLRNFGEALGIAFQITDDLLDYVGSTQKVGKEVGRDLLEGKVTLPLIAALRQSGGSEKAELIDFLKNGFCQEGFPRVLEFVEKYKGVEYSQGQAREMGAKACLCLQELSDSPCRESLKDLVEFAVERDK